jgi:transcriptional regulator with XRE-family HTH domain
MEQDVGRGLRPKGRRASETTSALGQRIRDRRLALGLTQAELGSPVFKGGYLSDVEHGRVTPSLDALEHLSSRLGVEVSELLGGSAAPAAPTRPADALARAHRLVVDAAVSASADDKPVLAAAALTLDALRRELTRVER